MRLVNADKYKGKVIASRTYCGVNKLKEMDTIPADYDIDAVIKQLELSSYTEAQNDMNPFDPVRVITLNDAIRIVKGGGINKDHGASLDEADRDY